MAAILGGIAHVAGAIASAVGNTAAQSLKDDKPKEAVEDQNIANSQKAVNIQNAPYAMARDARS